MIVSITGHRPKSLGLGYRQDARVTRVKQDIREHLQRYNATQVITGMALGMDQWAAEVAIDAGIPFIVAVPFRGQASSWPAPSQQHWNVLLSRAAQIFCVNVSTTKPLTVDEFYAVKCEDVPFQVVRSWLLARNTWMVKRADQVLALWNGGPGSTRHAVIQAEERGVPVLNIFREEYCSKVVPNGTRQFGSR